MSPSRRRRFAAIVQALESRQLLAAPPIVDRPEFAGADDTYSISVTPTGPGSTSTITPNTPIDGIAGSIENPPTAGGLGGSHAQINDFTIDVPSGPASIFFFDWIHTTRVLTVTVTAKTPAGAPHTTWTLGSTPIKKFTQTVDDQGNAKDHLTLDPKTIAISFFRYSSAGALLDQTDVNFDEVNNQGSGGGGTAHPYDSNFVATTPDVVETIEFGAGQVPVGRTSFAYDQTTTGATTEGLDYSAIDGVESLTLFNCVWLTTHLQNAVYTRRNPDTGQPIQRHRLGFVFFSKYSFSDSVLDDRPREATFHLLIGADQIQSYTYSGVNNMTQAATSTGWNYQTNTAWNLPANSSNVALPLDDTRNTPLDSVTFRFRTPVALSLTSFLFQGLTANGLTLTAADGNLTWTVGNLAAQQAADGKFVVKLLADKINTLETTAYATAPLFIGSAAKSWTLDRSAPIGVELSFDYNGSSPTTAYDFACSLSEPVTATAVDGAVPILIRRIDTGALVTTATAHVGGDGTTLDATFPNTLADARYRATLPAGSIRDAAGNLLASDLGLSFFVLAGDANHDAKVDFNDLVVLAQNYNATGKIFSEGNLNYSADGKVDFNDLVILAQQYNKSLPAAVTLPTNGAKRKIERGAAGELLA